MEGGTVDVPKEYTQADQGFDMYVVSPPMVSILRVPLRSLAEVGSVGLRMETADHRETPSEHWVQFEYLLLQRSRRDYRFVRDTRPKLKAVVKCEGPVVTSRIKGQRAIMPYIWGVGLD